MSFKTEFQRYKKAVEDDIKELEIVICWLEMTADANVSGVPKAEIAKLVSFYNPHKTPHLYGVGIKAIKK